MSEFSPEQRAELLARFRTGIGSREMHEIPDSLLRGMAQAAAGQTRQRPDLLEEEDVD